MSDEELPEPTPPEHPDLTEEEDHTQRGEDPDVVVGTLPDPPDLPDPDPTFQGVPGRAEQWEEVLRELGKEHRPRREHVYPYLLIRANASGDRGARPLWPPIVCWESPDILLIDASHTGDFDPNLLIASPRAGDSYRMFVRVWNLGQFPAHGVLVRGWAVDPGFIGSGDPTEHYFRQHFVGGAWVELTDRKHPGCVAVVELDRPWEIDANETGHHCLIAQVTCPLDKAPGPLLVNDDRHVAQRNLDIVGGTNSPMPLLELLGKQVPERFALEIIHAGETVEGSLRGLTGGLLTDEAGRQHRLVLPALDELDVGVRVKTGRHLLTAFTEDGRTIVARSDLVARLADRVGGELGEDVFDRPGGVQALLHELGPAAWERVGLVSDEAVATALVDGISRLLDVAEDASARDLAGRLGGPRDAAADADRSRGRRGRRVHRGRRRLHPPRVPPAAAAVAFRVPWLPAFPPITGIALRSHRSWVCMSATPPPGRSRWPWWSPPASPPMAAVKCWASTSATAKTRCSDAAGW